MSKKSFSMHYDVRVDSFNESTYNRSRQFIGSVDSEFEGRAVQSSMVQTDDPKQRYKGLKASDFCLENQMKVGVPLNPIVLSPSLADITEMIPNVKSSIPAPNE